jgi:alcohol dehydrogenase (cytochrome c)/quinohemoprotein ethanol dehydrogenase
MSFDASAGLMYLPVQETAFPYLADDDQTPTKLAVNLGTDMTIAALPDDPAVIEQVKEATSGRLVAWDPQEQKEVWRVEYPGAWNGGVLSTAGGIVFQGSAAGFLNAYRSDDGSKLWEFQAQTGIVAPPVSYQVDGEQYVSVSAGWGGIFPLITGPLTYDSAAGEPINRSRILTFKLGGDATLPPTSDAMRDLPDTSDYEFDDDRVQSGFRSYDRFCAGCHGAGAVGGGVIPDLRYSPLLGNSRAWQEVVNEGSLEERGMVSFKEELSIDDAESIRMFVIARNRFAREIGDTQRLSR